MKVVRLCVIEVLGEGCEQLMGTDVARLFPLWRKTNVICTLIFLFWVWYFCIDNNYSSVEQLGYNT